MCIRDSTIAWWVNSVSDRYVVVLFCGLGVMGVYSVASKIPSILNIFQTIFNQAWTLSAVKDFDPNDENGFFTRMYNSYNVLMIILCSILIMMSKLLAVILYKMCIRDSPYGEHLKNVADKKIYHV